MKKISLIFSAILLMSGTSYFACFGQTLTEQDYSELSRLFEEDVLLMGDTREFYANYQSTRLRATFSHSRVLTLNRNPNVNTSVNKILIIVNSSIYNQLSNKIERYACDINYVYGCKVIMEITNGGDHTNIKNLITTNQTNLDGVVFIGDIAAAWFEVTNDYFGYAGYNNQGYGYAVWPCDLYYMDIDGTWSDTDGNNIYDSHTGNVQPEIFIGRISTANMGMLLSEKDGLERYLDKNHKFWMGHTTVNKKFGLAYTDKDWVSSSSFTSYSIQHLYGHPNYDKIGYGNPAFGKTDYLGRLANNKYEFIQLACHADAAYLYMTGGGISSSQIFNNGTQAIGYNLFCCSACNWTAVYSNSNQGFLAGSHIYNANNSSLVVVGSTKTGSMLNFTNFYTPLGIGQGCKKTIGEALKFWWIKSFDSTHTNYIISWHYGMSIIGDPLVNFHHCMNNRCESEITLNRFDNSNTASHRYIVATDKIIANNYVIPSGKHVIFNAREIELNHGFECQLGGTFETIDEGCISNCSSVPSKSKESGQNTYSGRIVYKGSPCQTEPCVPGIILWLEKTSCDLVIVVNSHWILGDRIVFDNVEYFVGDEVTITGTITARQDIYSEVYLELEVETITLFDNIEGDECPYSSGIPTNTEQLATDIQIFPNPNNGSFTINTNFDPQEITSIRVLNTVGQMVYQQAGLPSNTIQLPFTTTGMFWVEITTSTQKFVKKMVVQTSGR